MESNGRRFIECYNILDKSLREIYNLKPNQTFSDVVRKVASVNSVIKKYEDDLIDYGRLRNAIVHRSLNNEVIAEPHDDIVLKFEQITRLITTPPRAIDCIANRKVLVVSSQDKVEKILTEMFKSGYSNVPVYDGKTLIGVVSRKMIVDSIGKVIYEKGDINKFLSSPCGEALNVANITNHYEVVPSSITIDNLLYIFQQNRKVSTVIITKTGSFNEPPLAIAVTADTIDMQTILDNY
ncbi:MAG: CBS domain-containing protein [bacterium]|nr:CBS domain-containing protein [bacterium]